MNMHHHTPDIDRSLHFQDKPELPGNIEAECAVLGAILINNDAYHLAGSAGLQASDFSEEIHSTIYAACGKVIEAKRTANPVTVRTHLPDIMIGDMTTAQYLARLATEAVTIVNAPDYAAAIIAERARSEVIASGQMLMSAGQVRDEGTFLDEIEAISGRLEAARLRLSGSSVLGTTFAECASASLQATMDAMSGKKVVGIDYHLPALYQMIGPLIGGTLIIVGGLTKHGKGQPLDAPVLTPFGFRPMGSLKVGSKVTAPDGSVTHVVAIYPLGERQIYEVEFHDGTKAEVTDDHLWLCHRSKSIVKRNGVGRVGPASAQKYTTLQIMDLIEKTPSRSFHIPVTAPVPFNRAGNSTQPIPPYLMGVLLGDGCLRGATPIFSGNDREIAGRVEAATGRKLVIRNTPGCGDTVTYSVTGCPDYVAYLRRCKLMGTLSNQKFIPKQYLHASVEKRLELARGLMDTDGWAGKSEKDAAAGFTTVSERLANDAAWLFRSLGAVVNITSRIPKFTHKGIQKEGQKAFVLRIKHPDAASLFTLERKKAKCAAPRSMNRTIVSIKPTRKAQAQCIRVAHPSSLYITNDFIVTHNSSLGQQILRGAADQGHPGFFYSGEMSATEILKREKARDTGIDTQDQTQGKVSGADLERLTMASSVISRLPIVIQDKRRTLDALCREIKAFRKRCRNVMPVIVVDSILLLDRAKSEARMSDVEFASLVTDRLKALSRDIDAPVIALGQLKKNTIERDRRHSVAKNIDYYRGEVARRPRASDLYGSVEKDADHVVIVFNQEVVLNDLEPSETSPERIAWEEAVREVQGKAEIQVALSRSAKWPNRRTVNWDGKRHHFSFPSDAQRGLF